MNSSSPLSYSGDSEQDISQSFSYQVMGKITFLKVERVCTKQSMVEKCLVNGNCKHHQLVVFQTVGPLSCVEVDLLVSLQTGPINVPLNELFKWECIIHSLERKVSEIQVLNIISLGVWLLNTELRSLRQQFLEFFISRTTENIFFFNGNDLTQGHLLFLFAFCKDNAANKTTNCTLLML